MSIIAGFMGVIIGILFAVVILALATPLFIGQLVNKPTPNGKSGPHYFTYPEEGKVKIIVRGDVVIRMIMIYADHQFARSGNTDSNAHWDIKSGNSQNPLEGINPFLMLWARYVYWVTGAVFTGFYPFQRVREYPLERVDVHRDEVAGADNLRLVVKRDYSDHLRVRQFLYPLRVAQADTQDNISVVVVLVIKAKVVNPHKAAFGVDRWDQQLQNLAANAVTNFTRTRPLSQVLAAADDADANALNEHVRSINEDTEKYGIEIDGVDILDISPNLTAEEKTKLYAAALAKPVGEATVIDGKSRADAQRELNKAVQEGGIYSAQVMQAEAFVKAAEKAKDGAVIFGPGISSEPVDAAQLAELRRLNRNNRRTT